MILQYPKVGTRRELNKIPRDMVFNLKNGTKEKCSGTGYEVFFCGKWWIEYADSNGNLHYGI